MTRVVDPALRRVAFGFAAYALVLGALAVYRWHIWSYGADTGTFTQVTLHAFSGFFDTPEAATHFQTHWAPLLAVLYPLTALTRSGLSLQLAQVGLIGVSVFPFFAFLCGYVERPRAATIALLVLAYPPLTAVAFTEFHEIAFYPVLAFALLWALDRGRFALAALAGALLLLVREEVLIVLAVFGAALAVAGLAAARRPRAAASGRTGAAGLLRWRPHRPRATAAFGFALATAACATLAYYFHVLLPQLGGWRATHFYAYPFARGPVAVALAAIVRPQVAWPALATPGRLSYLLEAFGPLVFLPLRSKWMLIALPGLLVDLLSSEPIAWRMGGHYAAIWAPWVLVAAADALARGAAAGAPSARSRTAAFAFAACALVYVAFDPLHPAHYLRAPYADRADAIRAFALVPADATVDTHDEWFARFAGSHELANHNWMDPEYAVFADDFPSQNFARRVLPLLRREVADGRYRIVARFGRVAVYRRTGAAGAGATSG